MTQTSNSNPEIQVKWWTLWCLFATYKLLCYHRRDLFVCVSHIARPSGRNWVGLYERTFDTAAIAVFSTCTVHVIFFHSLLSRVGCSFQGKLFSIFKSLCIVFLGIIFLTALPSRIVYSLLLHLDPREKISSPMQDLFCLSKPLTYPGSARVQCGLHRRTKYQLSQSLTFSTQTSVSCFVHYKLCAKMRNGFWWFFVDNVRQENRIHFM